MFVKTELDTNLNEAVSDVELMEYFGVVDDVNPDDESEPDDSDIEREAEDFEPYVEPNTRQCVHHVLLTTIACPPPASPLRWTTWASLKVPPASCRGIVLLYHRPRRHRLRSSRLPRICSWSGCTASTRVAEATCSAWATAR